MANVPTQVEYPTNYATDLTLRSYADTDFVRWVDWARVFVEQMEHSPLSGEQKSVVKRVLNMKERSRPQTEKPSKGLADMIAEANEGYRNMSDEEKRSLLNG